MITNKRIRKLLMILFKFLEGINNILKKNSNQIVMYSNLGFRDNTRALFDFLIENKYNNKYKIICSLNDYKKYKDSNIINVKYVSNITGIYYFLTSKYFFYSFGKYPIKPSKEQLVINLWHGSPLKKIGNLEEGKENIDYNYFTYILSTSELFSGIMQRSFNCREEQIFICGQPRNDLFFKDKPHSPDKSKKIVVWLPTFRRSEKLNEDNSTDTSDIPIFTSKEKLKNLDNFLIERNMQLILKLHPMQALDKVHSDNYMNIEILSDEDINSRSIHLYKLLAYSDALITDYSSVYFDYLLLDRPIGFTVNDIGLYSKRRGLVFDNPEDYMPGPKIHNEEEFCEFINNIYIEHDDYELERKRINCLVNAYKDGDNCTRILKFTGIEN